jgi:hypothetical protein
MKRKLTLIVEDLDNAEKFVVDKIIYHSLFIQDKDMEIVKKVLDAVFNIELDKEITLKMVK